jgi:photosystem I subunit PsaO
MGVWRFLVEGGGFNSFNRDRLCKDLPVVGLGLIGWIAPSSIPVINDNGLTGLFLVSIGP